MILTEKPVQTRCQVVYHEDMTEPGNFDPNELAKWLYDGLRETIAYRLKQTFNREMILARLQEKIPNQNQVIHFVLRQIFEKNGFSFEELKQGHAKFFVIRKRNRQMETGTKVRRLVLVPGFGDTPASWIPLYGLLHRELNAQFDEVLLIDFPGYNGFLSHDALVPSMKVLLGVVKTVCEANPPTVLMGHSLGGWLAARVAQDLDHVIDHLVVLAPSGLTPDDQERRNFGDFIVNNQHLPVEELLDLIMHEPKNLKKIVNEDVKRFYSQAGVREFVESVKPEDFIDHTKPFRARKLSVIWGENDQFVPAQWIRYWVEHYGHFLDGYLLKETGHLPQLERPIALAALLKSVLWNQSKLNPASEDQGWIKVQTRQLEFSPEARRWNDSRSLPEHA
jgi:pimeloyl-ACP methyl ester carboxylesterase